MIMNQKLTTEKVLILIDNAEKMDFFCKIIKKNNIKNITFIHSNLYTFKKAQNKFPLIDSILLKKDRSKSANRNSSPSIEEAKNKKIYRYNISDKQASTLKKLSDSTNQIWIFSGFQYSYNVIKNILDIDKTIFFEIGNFPNMYQFSKTGVNANANHNIEIQKLRLAHTVKNEDKEALINKLFNFRPPHIDRKISSKIIESFTNKIGDMLFNTLAPQKYILEQLHFAFKIYRSRKLIKKYNFGEFNEENNYVLFIGQVEEDTQTLFQSEETCLSALKKAKKIAKKLNLKLIVRLHPAEKNYQSLINITTYCKLNNILINNSGSLLSAAIYSEHVITINSTGGLHSILLDKKVTCLGSSFYKSWNSNDVVLYYKYLLQQIT